MGSDGVEPPESEDSRFTVCPATNYGITTPRIKKCCLCLYYKKSNLTALRTLTVMGFALLDLKGRKDTGLLLLLLSFFQNNFYFKPRTLTFCSFNKTHNLIPKSIRVEIIKLY